MCVSQASHRFIHVIILAHSHLVSTLCTASELKGIYGRLLEVEICSLLPPTHLQVDACMMLGSNFLQSPLHNHYQTYTHNQYIQTKLNKNNFTHRVWWAIIEEIAPHAEEMAGEKEMVCCVRSYHVYKDIWAAAIGEVLVCHCRINFCCKIIFV